MNPDHVKPKIDKVPTKQIALLHSFTYKKYHTELPTFILYHVSDDYGMKYDCTSHIIVKNALRHQSVTIIFKTHNKRFMRTHQIKFKHARYKNCNLKDVLFQNNIAYNY